MSRSVVVVGGDPHLGPVPAGTESSADRSGPDDLTVSSSAIARVHVSGTHATATDAVGSAQRSRSVLMIISTTATCTTPTLELGFSGAEGAFTAL
jgi:hypothetical protein